MKDQAEKLRKLKIESTPIQKFSPPDLTQFKTIAITSGKGGVGKTNIALNLGIALAKLGKRILILDADVNLGNLDVLLGLSPKYTLRNVISDEMEIHDILVDGPFGIKIIPASSGANELIDVESDYLRKISQSFQALSSDYDFLIIDTPSGVGHNVFDFIESANKIMIVTTPEPTAIIDAYAIVKILKARSQNVDLHLLINQTNTKSEAMDVYSKFNLVVRKFLGTTIDKWNYIIKDDSVLQAVQKQQPFLLTHPNSKASLCMLNIGRSLALKGENEYDISQYEPFHARLLNRGLRSIGIKVS